MSRQCCSSDKMSQRVSDGTEDKRRRLCCPFPPKVISSSLEPTARLELHAGKKKKKKKQPSKTCIVF